jgi:hypothetical protein
MELKIVKLQIVIPTKDFAFESVIKTWFNLYNYSIERTPKSGVYLKMEKGLPPSGWDVRQKYTDLLQNENCLVTFMDDDTLIPEEVLNYLLVDGKMKENIFIFGQRWWSNGPKRLNAKPENMQPCKVDIGQMFLHSSFLKGMQWSKAYENDGIFISQLYEKYPESFVFINNIDTWYNALQIGKGLYNGQIITIA